MDRNCRQAGDIRRGAGPSPAAARIRRIVPSPTQPPRPGSSPLEISDPGESEDVGVSWADPRALTCFGDREPAGPWSWHGPARPVTGRTWGGCLEVIDWILTAGRFLFSPGVLNGGVLLLETSEELLPARNVGWIVRSLGERGILSAVGAVLLARPPVSDLRRAPATERARLRAEQRDVVVEITGRYHPQAVVCAGIPFGHTRPQWILPHGGTITVDGAAPGSPRTIPEQANPGSQPSRPGRRPEWVSTRSSPFGYADDRPGVQQDAGDRVVAGGRQVCLSGGGQVAGH